MEVKSLRSTVNVGHLIERRFGANIKGLHAEQCRVNNAHFSPTFLAPQTEQKEQDNEKGKPFSLLC